MILWVMRNSNPKDVPSYKALQNEQARLRDLCGIPTIQYKSQNGDIYYLNDVSDMLKKNFENPETAQHIIIYMREHPEQLTPSFRKGDRQFYVDELAMLFNGRLVIPLIWVNVKGEVHAYCRTVTLESAGLVVGASEERILTDEFSMNLLEIVESTGSLKFTAQSVSFTSAMPNKYHELDKDKDHVVVWMPVWADDVSGACSKQYQKHINVYMCNGSLPGKLVQQEYHVNFVGSSQQVSATEMLGSVMKQVESTHANPIKCYNAVTGLPYLPADNPQQSEECSHIGHNGTFPCCVCHIGGTYAEKESDTGYESFYNVGKLRSADETRDAILEQIRLASRGIASHVEVVRVASGAVDKTAEYWIPILLSKSSELKRKDPHRPVDAVSAELLRWLSAQTKQPYNPLLDAKYLDPLQDTPVENLHTYLLGHEKYAWYHMHTSWDESTQALFTIRLQSTDTNGLTIPPIRSAYMMQYRNGLIGKHFKTLMQTVVFHIQDIVSEKQFTLTKALGELGAALWIAEIDDLEQYLEDLQVLIDNALDAWALIDPAKILKKIKLHLLKHLPAHIRRFGPSVRFSREVFECFNAVFCMCSVLSNHQAPSRDIALKNGELGRLKHIISGGYWVRNSHAECAGENVVALLHTTPILQQHLGWAPTRQLKPGSIRTQLTGRNTKAFNAALTYVVVSPSSLWIVGTHVVSQSEDVCPVGSWCVQLSTIGDRHFIARILEILHSSEAGHTLDLVTLREFMLSEVLHYYYEMPVLHEPEKQDLVVNSQTIQFIINVQHDCRAAGCNATGSIRQRQEQMDSDRDLSCIEHVSNVERYIVNTHALHNAA
ncbi:hypothetical protein F5050DRAFT_1801905 [Lentinula boryana]|uniref:Uncharacterized protein n=1 Tax=Lentinula boryana TaxID=40481 RepID=A0ABQ8Q020_9AGAR|nr:hypothetical protein F5050DRAFT_1801905 [Lentinula boryana]